MGQGEASAGVGRSTEAVRTGADCTAGWDLRGIGVSCTLKIILGIKTAIKFLQYEFQKRCLIFYHSLPSSLLIHFIKKR